ncbi:MAG: hypothetical protein Q8R24_07270 [Legionellaceae bacterium]|nr:hypothetical protein [Legionellaceae bacterium]
MKQVDLIRMHPWANDPNIRTYAEKFTQEQWQNIHNSGFPDLLPRMDPMYILAFLNACDMLRSSGSLEIPVIQAMLDSLKAQLQTSPLHIQEVWAWLGPNLTARIEKDATSYDMMDDLMQLLSPEETRNRLAHPLVSQNLKLNNQDLRELYRLRQITLNQFLEIIRASTESSQRQFPDWVGNHVEIRALADEFTDEQLAFLPTVLSNSILNDREFTCSFLRTVLAKTTIHDVQKVKECPLDSFESIVKSLQDIFLDIATQKNVRFNPDFIGDVARSMPNLGDSEQSKISQDIDEDMSALHRSLRNAAFVGNYWTLLPLTLLVSDVNSVGGLSGRTALHRAVEYANKTGDRLCFDLLANHPEIDFSVQDSEGKTALELWNFTRFPDAVLLSKLNELKAKPEEKDEEKGAEEKRASPLTLNNLFERSTAAGTATKPKTRALEEKEEDDEFYDMACVLS